MAHSARRFASCAVDVLRPSVKSKIKERKRSKKMNGPWLKTQMANFMEASSDRTAERLASGA
ncbi:hypothetical protein F443_22590 [Phytophthora nicotianae P1569]|uniref:Uncharacterized protein n=1 Tax=Phytophthora nicotianae P1569 TaxID=1317065 RepID=V9DTU7_PHYNI|nr:hypothetical protein F443_22590 [Phytophthora nicotianae P1569]